MKTEPHRILLVEDNPGDLRLLKEALRHHGIEYELDHYTAADTAIHAITMCGNEGRALPDLILIDYNIPRGDGRDILTAASKNPALSNIPKAIVTSSMAAKDREQAMELGARCFIIKPADLDGFLTHVGQSIATLLGIGADGASRKAAPS